MEKSHGGARKGAGRPATGRKGRTTSVYLPPGLGDLWRKIAQVRGTSKTQVLQDALEREGREAGLDVEAILAPGPEEA